MNSSIFSLKAHITSDILHSVEYQFLYISI